MSIRPSDDPANQYGPGTRAVRAGISRTHEAEHAEPIFLTSSYLFEDAEDARARFAGDRPGNVYSRYTNPTVRAFEQRLAALEGAEGAVATASGMAAILTLCMAILRAGDHVICSRSVFGTTVNLFAVYLEKFGVHVDFVDLLDTEAWRSACRDNTRMLFIETPSNPLNEVADVRLLADIAHAAEAMLVVDNTYATPVLQRPLRLGADVLVYSATKFIDGQGRCCGGAIVGDASLTEACVGFLRTCGPSLSPFNAWVMLKGLETLGVRLKAACASASALAAWLRLHPAVHKVHHPSLPEHPQHRLAKEQMSDFGAVLSFEVCQGRTGAWTVIDQTRMLSITANLGDVKTTITHPATTTHGRLSDEQRARAGISEGLVRISVGLEDLEDIQVDLQRGLDALS